MLELLAGRAFGVSVAAKRRYTVTRKGTFRIGAMQSSLQPLAVTGLLAVLLLLPACTTGKPLPASWPHIGLTLPGSADVKQLSEAFEPYTKDGVYAHMDDGETEVWAVCFSCPGGITQANVHFEAEMKRSGFTDVTAADFPFTYIGGITGYYGSTYLWLSEDKRTGVSLSFLDDLSEKAKEKTGDLCLMFCRLMPDRTPSLSMARAAGSCTSEFASIGAQAAHQTCS